MDNQELKGTVSLVTGAGRGIGRAIALKLAEMGSRVAINDLPNSTGVDEVVKEILEKGGEAISTLCDVSEGQGVKTMIKYITEKWDKIDILVNNAGVIRNSLTLRMTEEEWDKVIDTNLRGAFLCSKYALRSMTAQNWGRIINMASVAGLIGTLGRVNYAASKGGLIAFTRCLANEVGSRNVTVNAIAPGLIVTPLSNELPDEYRDIVLARTTLKRFGTVNEVAELAGFLASGRSSYITGQVISIDGGIT